MKPLKKYHVFFIPNVSVVFLIGDGVVFGSTHITPARRHAAPFNGRFTVFHSRICEVAVSF